MPRLSSPTPWFHIYRVSGDAALRLFCFPYAGGSARVFQDWPERIRDEVDVMALQAPGREERFGESPIGCVYTLAETIATEIEPFLDLPFMFVGHSNGSLVCFELTRALKRRGLPGPVHMILSGTRAAHLKKPHVIYDLPEDELVEKLRDFDATPQALIDNPRFLSAVLPLLRADFAIADCYRYRDGERLDCDLTLFWARDEKEVTREETLAWRELTDGNTRYVEFDGGHLFILDRVDEYVSECNNVIQSVLVAVAH